MYRNTYLSLVAVQCQPPVLLPLCPPGCIHWVLAGEGHIGIQGQSTAQGGGYNVIVVKQSPKYKTNSLTFGFPVASSSSSILSGSRGSRAWIWRSARNAGNRNITVTTSVVWGRLLQTYVPCILDNCWIGIAGWQLCVCVCVCVDKHWTT